MSALRDALVEPDAHPFRWMLDGTPCWCVSADKPHDGWVHAPACQAFLRERVAVVLRDVVLCAVATCAHQRSEHYVYSLNGHDQTRCRACDPHTGRRMPGLYAMDSDSYEAAMFRAADHDFEATE